MQWFKCDAFCVDAVKNIIRKFICVGHDVKGCVFQASHSSQQVVSHSVFCLCLEKHLAMMDDHNLKMPCDAFHLQTTRH